MNKAIEINHLNIVFHTDGNDVYAVRDVSLNLKHGVITGLIGETGSGKSVIASAVLCMLPSYAQVSGSIRFQNTEILEADRKTVRNLRRNSIGLIPQNPSESLNPARRILPQVAECFEGRRRERIETSWQNMEKMGLEDPVETGKKYPFQLSGGMKQRAISLFGMRKRLDWIIADEPTKGLDTVVYQQVFESLQALSRQGNRGMLVITHDLTLAAKLCDELVVLYEGEIVEIGEAGKVLTAPRHPYTKGLLASLPQNGMHAMAAKPLEAVRNGCRFRLRCPLADAECMNCPDLEEKASGWKVRCLHCD